MRLAQGHSIFRGLVSRAKYRKRHPLHKLTYHKLLWEPFGHTDLFLSEPFGHYPRTKHYPVCLHWSIPRNYRIHWCDVSKRCAMPHNAFGDCKSLSSATLPLSLERLEAPFDNSLKLKSIRFNGSKAKFKDSYKSGQPIKVACMDGILSVGE